MADAVPVIERLFTDIAKFSSTLSRSREDVHIGTVKSCLSRVQANAPEARCQSHW